jgi:hypothetical protein
MHKCRALLQTGAFRSDSRASDWVGYMVAGVLNINVAHKADNPPKDIARLKQILKTWFKNKVFATEERADNNRKKREFVIAGPWADPEASTPEDEPETE